MAELTREDLHRLARLGALRRLEELRREEAAIRAAFPELFRKDSAPAATGRARGTTGGTAQPARPRRKRRKMSKEARRAVSERMTKYWAERRKAKARKG